MRSVVSYSNLSLSHPEIGARHQVHLLIANNTTSRQEQQRALQTPKKNGGAIGSARHIGLRTIDFGLNVFPMAINLLNAKGGTVDG